MNSIRFESGLNLKEKREEFANEIRREKRKQIIGARRKILLQDFTKTMKKQPTSQLSNLPFGELIRLLESGSEQQESVLVEIRAKLSSPDQNINYLIAKLVQSGKCSYLVENLINRRLLQQTLSIISIIVSRPNPRHAQILVNKGIIEILFEFLSIQEFTGLVVNILGNICIESDDYCEIILINQKQQDVIHAFNSLHAKFINNQIVQNPELKLKTILWMLGVVISTKESTLDFETQYDAILYFCKDLMFRRVFINEAIETVYELAVKNSTKVQQILHTVINDLISQQTGQSPHLESLLYLIMKLTPGRFNYNKIFQLMFISEYKFTRQIIYIINKLGDSQVLNELVKNQAWWEKLLVKLDSGSQEFKITLTIIRKLKISFPSVWRFISEYIDDTYAKDVVLEILLFLKNQLYASSQALSQSSIILIENLHKYKIPRSLQKIALKQNYEYSSKAEQLMFLIEHLSKQLKQKYEIDVEI